MSFYNGIITSKLNESKEFYTSVLGFTVKFENEWFVLLERAGREIAFMLPDLEFQAPIFRDELGGHGMWMTVEVEDLDAELERIKSSGIQIAVELRTEDWGETHFAIADPSGIGIDFVKYRAA